MMPITTEAQLEELLSRPVPGSIEAMRQLDGPLVVLGAGGKMGPSLLRLARRSADAAGRADLPIIAVSRFSQPELRKALECQRITTLAADLIDPQARAALPPARNVLLMLGHKFSQGDLPGTYWVINTLLPGLLAEQYRSSRIVCFSSGNVYPFTPVGQPAPTEQTPAAPVGEYALTVWGRERVLQFISARYGTPVCLLRLNYAVEARYGVLVDLGQQILARQPIDLAVPEVNLIWQGYANAVALQSFALARSPAEIINLTGIDRLPVRELAERLGERLGEEPQFAGTAGDRALVSNARRCFELFGPPELEIDDLLDLAAGWLLAGGRTLGKPTKFQVRDGVF
jgi:nucleoside-diphosphate-sugar epimerase